MVKLNCYHHPTLEAVINCENCGKPLCRSCAELYNGHPFCATCGMDGYRDIKSDLNKRVIVGIALGIAWIVLFLSAETMLSPFAIILEGIVFACVPFGWRALTSITPKMFVWLPLVGWLIYFFIKLCISIIIGWVAAPIQISKELQNLKKIEALERKRNEITF